MKHHKSIYISHEFESFRLDIVRARCKIESEELERKSFEPATFSGLERRVNGSNQFLDNYNVNRRHELGPSTNS